MRMPFEAFKMARAAASQKGLPLAGPVRAANAAEIHERFACKECLIKLSS